MSAYVIDREHLSYIINIETVADYTEETVTAVHNGITYDITVKTKANNGAWCAEVYCRQSDMLGVSDLREGYMTSARIVVPMGPAFHVYRPYSRYDMRLKQQRIMPIAVEVETTQRIL